jgi:hypothetical protein
MIGYKKNRKVLVTILLIPIYNSENELSHWVSIQRDVSDENNKKRKGTTYQGTNKKQ